MIRKNILRKIIPIAVGILLAGQEVLFLPAYGQAASRATPTIASIVLPPPHNAFIHHIDVGSNNSWAHTGNASGLVPGSGSHHFANSNAHQNSCSQNQSASTSQNTVSSHNHVNSTNQENLTGNSLNPNHTFNFFHHHDTWTNNNNLNNQTASTNTQPAIGGYHAGYVMHHGAQNLDTSLVQQNNAGSGSATLNYHFLHNQNNSSNQEAITLSGSKSANGSLLGSADLPSFLNLNLSSSQLIISANNSAPVMITVGGFLGASGNIIGGMHQLVTPGQMLTAAQYTAMEQVVTSGQQTLVLSGHGTAISGLITLVAGEVNSLSSLQVPTHVVVDTVGFTSTNQLSVAGITQINGSLYTLEQTANITAGLSSGSLLVGGHGLISDSLSSSSSLFNSLFAANGLNIGVVSNLTNQGTITSTGTLNVSANQIANVSTPNNTAIMNGQTLNLYSTSGNVTNSGQLLASSGNVNFNTTAAQNLNINNTNGTIQSLQGAITLRDSSYAGSANLNLTGGNWLSNDLNLNSGTGVATANIGNVTGAINTNAGEAHITAATPELIIGNTNLSGDPSYFNTIGSIVIGANLNFSGQNLAIVAENNILAEGGTINTSSATGNGGNITIIAGSNAVSSGSTSGNADTTSTLTITGGSTAGGYINLNEGPALNVLSSASTHTGSNGGNTTLVAYGGSGAGSGVITLPPALTVNTSGSGSGSNGNVTIIAGATSGTTISVGSLNTTGGTGGGGNITLLTQTPVISGGPNMTIVNGAITNGTTFTGGTTNAASIVAGSLTSPGGTITAIAGQTLTTGSVTSNGAGSNGNGGNIILQAGASTAANLQVSGSVSANGISTGSGGTVNVSYNDTVNPLIVGATGSNSYVNGNISANGGVGGAGGTVNITNTGNGSLGITLSGNITASGNTLGNLNFTSQSGQAINVTGTGSLIGVINNNVSAANVLYSSGIGNLNLGNISNTSGNITATTNDPNGAIYTTQNITSASTLNFNSGSNGSITIATGTTNTATSITITTPSLVVGNNAALIANVGNLDILSNGAGNALTVSLGQGSSITGNNIIFNTAAAPGAITMNSGFGDLSATITNIHGTALGNVVFNGGTTGAVNVSTNSIYSQGIAGYGSSINVTVASGGLSAGLSGSTASLTSYSGDINLTNTAPAPNHGSVILIGIINSANNLTVTSGNIGSVYIIPDAIVSAKNAITINTSYLSLYAGTSITANNGNLTIVSNTPGNALTVNLSSTSSISGTNVLFNTPSTLGAITVNSGVGTITAKNNGQILLSGGTDAVIFDAMTINGIFTGAGTNYLAGSLVNVIVTNGNLTVGNLSSPGIVTFTNLDNTTNNGNIIVTAALSSTASSVNLSSGSAGNITVSSGASIIANTGISLVTRYLVNNGNISTQTGNLNIQSNGKNNALTLALGSGSTLTAVTGNVNFNPINAGSVNIPYGGSFPLFGDISANGGNGQVNLNIGTGTANVWVNSIAGIVQDPNANFSSPAAGSVLVIVSAGQLTIGDFATSAGNGIQAVNTATNGTLVTAGNLLSGAGITLIGGNNGSLTIGTGNTITATTNIYMYAPVQNINGIVTATNGLIVLQSYGTNNSLVVNMGPAIGGVPTQLTAINGNVEFNTTIAGAITITGGPGNGLISAYNNDVVLNGGTGAVNTTNQQIIGCIHVNGSSINMQTSVGDLDFCLGINTSSGSGSGGNITIAANGGAINSGAITTNGSGAGNSAGNITLSASSGMNLGDINANGNNGASGGIINLSSPGQTISGTYISATGSGAGSGGSITTSSGTLVLAGVDGSGNSITTNATGTGTGGPITITTTAPQAFIVGNGATSGNGTLGNISSNGVNGGFIILANNSTPGGANQIINGQVTANGTTGSGGKVELEVEPFGSATLTTIFNGGLIQATNTANNLGRVGFNGGPGQNINILGTGTVNGGEFVHVGNLDRITLEFLNVPAGIITISPSVIITNNFATNGTIPVIPVIPTTPVTGSSSLPLLSFAPQSTPALSFPPPYYPPTDFTPWGHFHYQEFQPKKERARFALGLAYKRRTTAYIPGTRSYSHTFTDTETDRLARDGMQLFSSTAENYLSINKGNILLSPDKDILIGTHEGKIAMAPGAIAFVMESGSDVVVYNLRQSAPNQVSVTVNTHKIILHPGSMLVLTRQKVNDFENIDADCHMISYRGAQEVPMNDQDVKAFVAQYSIASAMTAVEPLQQLIASNNPQDTTVLNKIVLSAVMLGDFTRTIDTAQLANLDRDAKDRLMNENEKVIDSAKQMATSKNQPIQ